jgi:uncharacterized protein YndB with AHSA1/START domain
MTIEKDRVVEQTIRIEAAPDAVWTALTEADALARWSPKNGSGSWSAHGRKRSTRFFRGDSPAMIACGHPGSREPLGSC